MQVGIEMFLSCSSEELYNILQLSNFFHEKDWFTLISSDIKNNPKSPKPFSFDVFKTKLGLLCFIHKDAVSIPQCSESCIRYADGAKTLH